MRHLLVHQVGGNEGKSALAMALKLLLLLVICSRWWCLLRLVNNIPKVLCGKEHLHLELPTAEVLTIELVDESKALTITRSHVALLCKLPLTRSTSISSIHWI